MVISRLLFGAGLAGLFLAAAGLLGSTIGLWQVLSALLLLALPGTVAGLLDRTAEGLSRLDGTEDPGADGGDPTPSELFAATGATFLGHGDQPFAFTSLAEARRCARRRLATYGIIACDGYYFVTDRHLDDRGMARAHIRATYALAPEGPGAPVVRLGQGGRPVVPASQGAVTGSALARLPGPVSGAGAVSTGDRLRETRQAMMNATPWDRLPGSEIVAAE